MTTTETNKNKDGGGNIPIEKKSASFSSSCFYHIASTLFDYVWLYADFQWANFCFIPHGLNFQSITMALTVIVLSLQIRENVYFLLFGNDIAKIKREYIMSWIDYYYVCQTTIIFILEGVLAARAGLFYFTKIEFSWETYCEVFLMFYALQISKDFFSLYFLHEYMHEQWYFLHKGHHEVRGNANSLLAFHIDPIDLFFENICSPVFVFAAQYFLGYEMGVHVGAILLVAFMDANIHSINPFSVLLWNPLLDLLFRCNIAHNLHHTINKENYMFIPYHHAVPQWRKSDVDRYNKLLETAFVL